MTLGTGIIYMGYTSPGMRVGIVVDVSSSMPVRSLRVAAEAGQSVCSHLGIPSVDVIYFNDGMAWTPDPSGYGWNPIKDRYGNQVYIGPIAEGVIAAGIPADVPQPHGNTRMDLAIQYMTAKGHYDIIIVLTDGDSWKPDRFGRINRDGWPESPPPMGTQVFIGLVWASGGQLYEVAAAAQSLLRYASYSNVTVAEVTANTIIHPLEDEKGDDE